MNATATGAARVWGGRLALEVGRALYVGPAFETTRHAHHAIQVCVSLAGPLRLRTAARDRWQSYDGVVVAADHPHELAATGEPVALLYVEPESTAGRALTARPGITALPAARVSGIRALLRRPRSDADLAQGLLGALGADAPVPRPLDPRVAAALASIPTAPDGAALAASVGLSPDRFRHLVREQLGLPLRHYRLWRRLETATAALARGAEITDAALDAGFADAAHLTRTCRRMLGVTPASLPRPRRA